MTKEELQARLDAFTDQELVEMARPAMQRFIKGKGILCVPVQATDDDMVLSALIDRFEARAKAGEG